MAHLTAKPAGGDAGPSCHFPLYAVCANVLWFELEKELRVIGPCEALPELVVLLIHCSAIQDVMPDTQ